MSNSNNFIERIIEWIKNSDFITIASNLDFIKGIIAVIVTMAMIAIALLTFTKNINKKTKNTISSFIENGKYIDGLFVEIDNRKELLRCFIFSKRFKKKLINKYNKLINNKVFKDIEKETKHSFKLHNYYSITRIEEKLNNNKKTIEGLNEINNKSNMYDMYFPFYTRKVEHDYQNKYEELLESFSIARNNSLMVTGNAGNGKTTLLCNAAEAVINANYPCFFINSRDVHVSLLDYFYSALSIPKSIKKSTFLRLLNILLCLYRKHLFIIVDALNENDTDVFRHSIEEFQKEIKKYKRFKVVYSCREEFYKIRSDIYFTETKPYVLKIDERFINKKASEMIFHLYREYFNYSGNISDECKNKLLQSLLLMRMFFEVNRNQTNNTSQLHNHKIFSLYIDKINTSRSDIKFSDVLDKVADIMLQSKEFNDVNCSDLNITNDILGSMLDNNLVLTNKVLLNKGQIHEEEITKVYFTFDEIRDYYISKRIVKKCSDINNFEYLFEICDYLYNNKLSAIEGVLKYSYFHLIENNLIDQAKDLLSKYYDYELDFRRRKDDGYIYLWLSIVMECPRICFYDFEEYFIFYCMNSRQSDFIKVFRNLTKNEINGYTPDLTVFINCFMHTKTDIKQLKQFLNAEFFDNYYPFENRENEKLIYLKNYLIFNKDVLAVNKNLIKLVIILSILMANDTFFYDIIINSVLVTVSFNELISACENEEIKPLLIEAKKFYSDYHKFVIDTFENFEF